MDKVKKLLGTITLDDVLITTTTEERTKASFAIDKTTGFPAVYSDKLDILASPALMRALERRIKFNKPAIKPAYWLRALVQNELSGQWPTYRQVLEYTRDLEDAGILQPVKPKEDKA